MEVVEGDTPPFLLFYYSAIKCRLLVGSLYENYHKTVQDWYTDFALKYNQKMYIYQISNGFLRNLWAMLTISDAQVSIAKRVYNRSSHSRSTPFCISLIVVVVLSKKLSDLTIARLTPLHSYCS